MRTPFTFVAVVDGVETGEASVWSVEGYVKEARASAGVTEAELALFNALMIYVDSALAAIDPQQ